MYVLQQNRQVVFPSCGLEFQHSFMLAPTYSNFCCLSLQVNTTLTNLDISDQHTVYGKGMWRLPCIGVRGKAALLAALQVQKLRVRIVVMMICQC